LSDAYTPYRGNQEKKSQPTLRKGVFIYSYSGLAAIRVISQPTDEVQPAEFEYTRAFYTAFHKNIPAGISGCRKKRLNNGTFF
jgi:hypothetical protein